MRRSRTNRFAAGVAGGLGEYFGVDPVLFRVLFATSAFFGGFGVLAYLLAWAAIPEQGTEHAAVDRWVADLRRWRVPVWLVVLVGVLIVWGVSFSWWAPRPFVPLLVIAIVVILVLSLRGRGSPPVAGPAGPGAPGGLGAPGGPGTPGGPYYAATSGGPPASAPTTSYPAQPDPGTTATFAAAGTSESTDASWGSQARQWLSESQERARVRRMRARPVLLGTLAALAVGLGVLVIADVVHGVVIPAYFWVTGAIVLAGLVVGAVLRRAPWGLSVLLIPVLAGMIAFGNTGASFHDGSGSQEWAPTNASGTHSDYRLAFGQGTLDLRQLDPSAVARTIDVTMAGGQVRVLLPATMNTTVDANVRIGAIEVDGAVVADTHGGSIHRVGGYDINHVVLPPQHATGAPVTVNVHLADGQIEVRHTS